MKTRVLLSLLAFCGVSHAQAAPAPTVALPSALQPQAPFFPDVPRDHWAFAAVQRLAGAGIVQGFPPATTPQIAVAPAPRVALDANVVKVKTALGENPGMKGTLLNVDRINHKSLIVLTGSVKSDAQRHLASAIVRKNVPGFGVVNQLRVAR